jgi:hypothetical protein
LQQKRRGAAPLQRVAPWIGNAWQRVATFQAAAHHVTQSGAEVGVFGAWGAGKRPGGSYRWTFFETGEGTRHLRQVPVSSDLQMSWAIWLFAG